jgi:hypothetical protein
MRCRSHLLKTRERFSESAGATSGGPIAVTFREAIEVIGLALRDVFDTS